MKTDIQFIIHELRKEPNGLTTKKYRTETITATEDVVSFVEEVTKLFRSHSSGRLYGAFETNEDLYPFPKYLGAYLKEGDLVKFSQGVADLLAKKLNDTAPATGGYLFVVRFADGNEDMLLLCMLNQKQSPAVDQETLMLTKTISLQMDHLDLTAQINLTDWKGGKPEPVSLIKGRKELSHYFRDFIGLHEPRSNTEATKKFRDLADQWMDEKGYDQGQKETVRQNIIQYSKAQGKEPLDLDHLSRLVDATEHEAFFNRANGEGLSAEFHLHHGSLGKWARVHYKEKDGGIRLDFPKRLLNTRVKYDREKKVLTIKNIELKEEDLQ